MPLTTRAFGAKLLQCLSSLKRLIHVFIVWQLPFYESKTANYTLYTLRKFSRSTPLLPCLASLFLTIQLIQFRLEFVILTGFKPIKKSFEVRTTGFCISGLFSFEFSVSGLNGSPLINKMAIGTFWTHGSYCKIILITDSGRKKNKCGFSSEDPRSN